jgi:hypothetical protein
MFSEIVLLNNGEIIKGSITQFGDDKIIVKTNYGELTVTKADIKKIYIDEKDYDKENTVKIPDQSENKKTNTALQKDILQNNLEYYTQKKLLPLGVGLMVSGFSLGIISIGALTPITVMAPNPVSLSFLIGLSTSGLFLQTLGIISLVNGCIAYSKYMKTKDNVYEKTTATGSFQTFLSLGTGFLIPGAILTSIGIGIGIPVFIMPLYMRGIESEMSYQFGVAYLAAFFSIGVVFDIFSIVFYGLAGYNKKKWNSFTNAISYDLGIKNEGVYAEIIVRL